MIISFEQYLAESGFSRLRSIMLGDVPHVNQFAILTAQNPQAKETPDKENKKRNKDLMRDLRLISFNPVTIRKGKEQEKVSGFGPIPIKGRFGRDEDSFFIPHMDKEKALYYGKKYEQEAVIWASKHKDENDNPYFKFEYIDVASGDTHNTRIVSVAAPDVQTRDDMFSQKGGFTGPPNPEWEKKGKTHATSRKFVIPFFHDDDYAYYKPGKKLGTITPPDKPDLPEKDAEEALRRHYLSDRKIEFYIPFVDEVINGIMPLVDTAKYPPYFSSDLPDTPEVQALVKEIREREKVLSNENVTNQKSKLHNRLLMGDKLLKLSYILEAYKKNSSV